MCCKKGVLRNLAKSTGKHLWQRLFFNKVAGQFWNLIRSLCHRCFPVNFAKFLRTNFFTEYLRWLLLPLYIFGGILTSPLVFHYPFYQISRNSRLQMFFEICTFKSFTNFTWKHLCSCLFFNKVADLKAYNFMLKPDSNAGVSLWNLRNF